MLGIGRVGGILGPIILGAALAADWAAGTLFLAMGIPVLVSGLAVLFLDRRYGTRDGQAAAAVPTPSPAGPSPRT
jgi:AAHS family 4-hydroxybenzoate transporter-like MFS transporter